MKHTIALLVLLHKKSWADSNPRACANGVDPIKCVDGKKEGTETSCKDACAATGGSCCTYAYDGYYGGLVADACSGFNGSVCPDGSCYGSSACQDANIGLVVNGCTGYYACAKAGFMGGYIGMIIDSCKNGAYTCYAAGYDSGTIGQIVSSCAGTPDVSADYACAYAARSGSTISGMKGSCNNEKACHKAGYAIEYDDNYDHLFIPYDIEPTLVNCCNGHEECNKITEFPDFCPKSKSGKTAKSTKSTKNGKVADKTIQADLNFQGIEFSMMAGDESLSYDQSVDVGLLSQGRGVQVRPRQHG